MVQEATFPADYTLLFGILAPLCKVCASGVHTGPCQPSPRKSRTLPRSSATASADQHSPNKGAQTGPSTIPQDWIAPPSPSRRSSRNRLCGDGLTHAWRRPLRPRAAWGGPWTAKVWGRRAAVVSLVLREPLRYLHEGDNVLQDGSARSQRWSALFCIHGSFGDTGAYFSPVHNPETQFLVLLPNYAPPCTPRSFVYWVPILPKILCHR